MIRRPPSATRTDTLFPYTTLFRSSTMSRRPTAIRGSSMPACLTHGSIEGFSCPKCRAGLPREGETVVSEGQPGYWSISQETAEAIRDIDDNRRLAAATAAFFRIG